VNLNEISGQTPFSVTISIPQRSGIATADYLSYTVTNDTLYVIDNGYLIDTGFEDIIIAKYLVESSKMKKLKDTIAKTDTLGQETDLCSIFIMGWPRFFVYFNDNGRERNGYLANIYRQNFFDIVDIFNEIYPDGDIINYNRADLIKQESDCMKKLMNEK
jgi:hypothetical protein